MFVIHKLLLLSSVCFGLYGHLCPRNTQSTAKPYTWLCSSLTLLAVIQNAEKYFFIEKPHISSKSNFPHGIWLIRSVECQLSVPQMGPTHTVVIAGLPRSRSNWLINNLKKKDPNSSGLPEASPQTAATRLLLSVTSWGFCLSEIGHGECWCHICVSTTI